MPKLNNLIEKIHLAQNILIITHQSPDGDALGSMLALNKALQRIQKNTCLICSDTLPKLFMFLPASRQIKKDFLLGDHDLIFILDCGDLRRTGFAERLKNFARKKRQKIINIDHHPKNDVHRIAWFNLVDYSASSTSELIYKLIKEMQIPLDKNMATSLLCGLYTDTGAFRHSNTTPEVLKMAAELLCSGARLKQITKNVINGKSISALKLWGLVLSRIKKHQQLGLVTSVITQEDLHSCQATAADLAGAVNLINSIPDTQAAILFSETEDSKIKASIRTERNDLDISRLANLFGGGGLKKASGFTIDGKLIKDNNGGWKVKLPQ